MRCVLAVILVTTLLSCAGAQTPCPCALQETAWLCESRINGKIPCLGRLYHASVLICPPGEPPIVYGPDGVARSNPACEVYGTQPGHCRFLLEETQRVGVRCTLALIPADEVRRRIAEECRRWRLWNTCQHAAKRATGHGD